MQSQTSEHVKTLSLPTEIISHKKQDSGLDLLSRIRATLERAGKIYDTPIVSPTPTPESTSIQNTAWVENAKKVNSHLYEENKLLKTCLQEYEQAKTLEKEKDEKVSHLESSLAREKGENEELRHRESVLMAQLQDMKRFMENAVERLDQEHLEHVKYVTGLVESAKYKNLEEELKI